jgi:8-oxo-dGTP pyrophosphatase MutT (NUDIX family)
MMKHFTSTVFIIQDRKVLLIYHKKFLKWMPPGGHLDPDETPPQTAIREAKEETGLDIAIISQEEVWFKHSTAESFERPFHCMLAYVPPHKEQPAHYHMDLVYLAKPCGGTERQNHRETDGLRWFSLEDANQLIPGQQIFEETLLVIQKILSN